MLAGDGARGASSGELASRGGGLLREPARRTTDSSPTLSSEGSEKLAGTARTGCCTRERERSAK